MSKHSPEPWEVTRSTKMSGGESTVFAGLRPVVGTTGVRGSDLKATKANAERIVACVNACAGVENPVAILDALMDMVDHHIEGAPKDYEVDYDSRLFGPYARALRVLGQAGRVVILFDDGNDGVCAKKVPS